MLRRKFLKTTTATVLAAVANLAARPHNGSLPPLLAALSSPILFQGDRTTAYRDPAAIYRYGFFYLYFSYVKTLPDGIAYNRVAWTKSRDLRSWTPIQPITPSDKNLDFSSPGDVVRYRDHWLLCMQTYPRPHGEKYGNRDSRLWTASSPDLERWGTPELLRVKGPNIAQSDMGRMIDPFLLQDKDDPHKWWCFYKQNGIRLSSSGDLKTWTPVGAIAAGENPCVIVDRKEYLLFHSPSNGIGMMRSSDLLHWQDDGLLTLGQQDWPWARGRLTAGFVLDLRKELNVGKALMFFHGSQYAETDARGGFDNFASIGMAWSDDLKNWSWPDAPVAEHSRG